MIALVFWILSAAVLVGLGLAVLYIRGPQARPAHWAIGLVHGLFGAASLGLLLAALRRGLPPTGMGTAGFAPTTAVLLGIALLLGLLLARAAWRRRRPAGALVGAHASFAIAGFVVLLALFALTPAAREAARSHQPAAAHGAFRAAK